MLLTDIGKAIVWDHENDANAWEIYKKVVAYYLKSTKASLDSSVLPTLLLSDWVLACEGINLQCCLHWQDKVCLYEKQSLLMNTFNLVRSVSCYRMLCILSWNYILLRTKLTRIIPELARHSPMSNILTFCWLATSSYDAMCTPKETPSLRPKGHAAYTHDVTDTEFYDAQEMDKQCI